MKNLLNSTDLLAEPRVVAAYWELKGKTEFAHKGGYVGFDKCSKCLIECEGKDDCPLCSHPCSAPDPIPGPIERVAFEMRDACDRSDLDWVSYLMEMLPVIMSFPQCFLLNKSEPKHWIIAATLAYREGQK